MSPPSRDSSAGLLVAPSMGPAMGREHVDQILMGRELSTIVRDLPIAIDLPAARLGDYDRDTVVRLFREYEFRTLIERLPPMSGLPEITVTDPSSPTCAAALESAPTLNQKPAAMPRA